MLRRSVLFVVLLGSMVSLGGCLSLDFDEDVRQINHYGKEIDSLRKLTNKYFFDYDQDDPFVD